MPRTSRTRAEILEKQFDEISEEAIIAAELVYCSLEEFRDGLIQIRDDIQNRLDLVEDELRGQGSRGEND